MRYDSYTPGADATGDIEALSMWAGQTSALVKRAQPAAEIVGEIMAEAKSVISSLHAWNLTRSFDR
jgi:nitronate monooxygenase